MKQVLYNLGSVTFISSQEQREIAYWLRGVMELCIYPPKPSGPKSQSKKYKQDNVYPATEDNGGMRTQPNLPLAWSCSEEAILESLQNQDPSGQGIQDAIALRLLQVRFNYLGSLALRTRMKAWFWKSWWSNPLYCNFKCLPRLQLSEWPGWIWIMFEESFAYALGLLHGAISMRCCSNGLQFLLWIAVSIVTWHLY